MTSFKGGPADGTALALKRVPAAVFLRVVRKKGAIDFDALDMLDDTPADDEEIFLYQLAEYQGAMRLSRRPRSLSGWYQMATYAFVPLQPADFVLREPESWEAWCNEHGPAAREALKRDDP